MKSKDHQSATEKRKPRTNPEKKIGNPDVHPILQLQKTIGNRAVTKMIQRQQHQPGPERGGYFDYSDDPGAAPTNMPSSIAITLTSSRPFQSMRLSGMRQEYFGRDEVEAEIANRRARQ